MSSEDKNIFDKAEQLNELAKRNSEEAGALLLQALELLEEMAQTVVGLEADLAALTEQVDDLDDDFQEICEDIYGEDEDEIFEVECPNCGEHIQIDEGILEDGSITCPGCEETLEFEMGCDCDCCGHDDCCGGHDDNCCEHGDCECEGHDHE